MKQQSKFGIQRFLNLSVILIYSMSNRIAAVIKNKGLTFLEVILIIINIKDKKEKPRIMTKYKNDIFKIKKSRKKTFLTIFFRVKKIYKS